MQVVFVQNVDRTQLDLKMSTQASLQRLLDSKLQMMIPLFLDFPVSLSLRFFMYAVMLRQSHLRETVEREMFKTHIQTQWQLQWLPLPCDCSNLSWTISVQTLQQPKPRFCPAPKRSICLLCLASTSDLRMNMLSAANTGPVTACLPPACASSQASPKIKQIIITERDHLSQGMAAPGWVAWGVHLFFHLYDICIYIHRCALSFCDCHPH